MLIFLLLSARLFLKAPIVTYDEQLPLRDSQYCENKIDEEQQDQNNHKDHRDHSISRRVHLYREDQERVRSTIAMSALFGYQTDEYV